MKECDCQWYLVFKFIRHEGTVARTDTPPVQNDAENTIIDSNTASKRTAKVMITKLSNLHNHEPSLQEKLTVIPTSTKQKHIDPIVFLQ